MLIRVLFWVLGAPVIPVGIVRAGVAPVMLLGPPAERGAALLADVLVAFFHPQRRALHDLIARSMVVRLDFVQLAPHAPLPDPHGPDADTTGATREP